MSLLPLACLLCLAVASGSKLAKFEPPRGKTVLVVGQDIENIANYLAADGPMPGGFAAYTSLREVNGLDERSDVGGGVMFARALIDAHPNTVLQLGLYITGYENEILSGAADSQIDRLARWIASTHRPVYLRIGYEFDFPGNNFEPEKYVKAYRRIVDHIRAAGVSNVAFVWHSYAREAKHPAIDWYPGDGYVDWFAVSYFEQGPEYLDSFAVLAHEHHKPLMIAESAPWFDSIRPGSGTWGNWFKKVFAYIARNDVKMFCYIDNDWATIPIFKDMKWGDSRLQSDPEAMRLWTEEVAKKRYLRSNPQLYRTLGYGR